MVAYKPAGPASGCFSTVCTTPTWCPFNIVWNKNAEGNCRAQAPAVDVQQQSRYNDPEATSGVAHSMLCGVCLCVQAKYLAASTGKDEETIMQDFSRPKYFSPFEAADYGIIDQVGGQQRTSTRGAGLQRCNAMCCFTPQSGIVPFFTHSFAHRPTQAALAT
jgi:hypothetical protein